jgi:hypothetical protein
MLLLLMFLGLDLIESFLDGEEADDEVVDWG